MAAIIKIIWLFFVCISVFLLTIDHYHILRDGEFWVNLLIVLMSWCGAGVLYVGGTCIGQFLLKHMRYFQLKENQK